MALEWAHRLAVALAFALAVLVVYFLDRPAGNWGRRLRLRFVLGVPWGTLVSAALVVAVYLFLQGGLAHWYRPVVLPFRAWSYLYPLGMVTASFAHASPGHLLGNLVGAVTVAPLAEYAWGHYPTERGSTSFGTWRTNPYVRALVLFPAVVVIVGVLTSFFALGPVVGFSGVVFAFVGFALVHFPLGTIVALTTGTVVRLVYSAFQEPISTASARPTFATPWWADIAIQGHALGLFVGVLLGVALLDRRSRPRPSALRLWTGTLLVAATEALWAVYWFRGGDEFVLYRAVGTALVVLLSTLIAAAVTADTRPLFDRLATETDGESFLEAVQVATPRQVATTMLVLSAAVLAGPAVPVNLVTATEDDLPGRGVSVRDYEVTYAENVENGMVSAIDVEAFGESTTVNTSGVVVRSAERGIWTTAVTKNRLAFAGRTRVQLGGVGWREAVLVERQGWNAVGGDAAYRVIFREDGERTLAYTSDSATADPVVAGRNVSVAVGRDAFDIVVTRENRTVGREPMLGHGETTTLGGLRFEREGDDVYAMTMNNETRVKVLSKETYRGRDG